MNKKTNTEKLNIESSNTYDRVGGEKFFYNLIDKFYAYIESDEILRPMYPEDLAPGKSHLSKFLIQFWGGPNKYSEEKGHPRLRNRHINFAISQKERDIWVSHMFSALESMEISVTDLKIMKSYFEKTATMIINS